MVSAPIRLLKEDIAEIRTMDGHVATGAISARLKAEAPVRHARLLGMRITMTLQADEARFPPREHEARRRPVRCMAHGASFDAHRGVLEDKRAVLLGGAVGARLPSRLIERHRIRGAVRAVAIAALHRSFRHTMMERLCELAAYLLMARIAKRGLRIPQHALAQPSLLGRQLRDL